MDDIDMNRYPIEKLKSNHNEKVFTWKYFAQMRIQVLFYAVLEYYFIKKIDRVYNVYINIENYR